MTSKLVVNTIEADTGISSVSFASSISMSSTSKFHFSDAGIDIGADTNISRPANGVLGFNINGAEKFRIDSNGHIKATGVCTATHFYGDGSNLTGLTVPGGATNLDLVDSSGTGNGRVRLGASQDLQIYHDGSHSWFKNTEGRLILQTDGDQLQLRGDTIKLFNGAGNSTYASVDTNNHLLYTAGIERFRIYNDGVVAIGQSSKSGTVGAGGLDIQGNGTNCIIEMGNPFPSFSGGVVPEFRITATNSGHEVKFESVWGGDNALHPHLAFAGGSTIFYNGMSTTEVARFNGSNFGINRTNPSSLLHIQTGNTTTYNINSAVTNGILTISSNAGGGVGKCVGLQFNGPNSNGEGFITMVGISNSEMDMHFGMRSGGNRGDKVVFESGGRVRMPGVYSTNGSNMRDVQIESDGTLCAGNTSVRASKTNIQSLSDVSWLYDLNPVTFNYRKRVKDIMSTKYNYLDEAESETSYGLIAEDVESVKKDFCFYNKDENNDDELSGVHYNQLITPLLKAIQDQKKEIDTLKAKVATLEGS